MLIVCTGCRTIFSFDSQRVRADGIKLRCGRCNTIFRVIRKSSQQATAPLSDISPLSLHPAIKVVVANESADFCQAVSDVLARESFTVSAYNDGREAFDAILQLKPDVVLLDVALPSMYGFEVCEAIRKIPELASVKVILIASIYDKTRYKRAPVSLYGADDYIEKHHIPDSLATMIYRLVSGQKAVEPLVGAMEEAEEEAQTSPEVFSAVEMMEQEVTRRELKRDEESETSYPTPHSEPELSEAHGKSRHLARIIVSDIVLYNQVRVEEGVKNGSFYTLLADDIAEGRALYLSRVPQDIIRESSYLEEAFEELIKSKKQELGFYNTMESMEENIAALQGQLRSADEETRRSAVLELAGYPLEESKAYIFAGMGDESWRVRKEAVDALLAAPIDEKVMEEIVDLLESHDNAGLRNSAVEALQRLGSRAVPVICRHGEDTDADVRKFVLDILGNIGDASAVPVMVKALDDPEPNVSAAAAENLGKIGDAEAVPFLVQALEKTDIWLRYTILEALGRIGKPVPMATIAPMAAEKLLKKAVFNCMGAIGDCEAVPLLLEGIMERVRNAREAAVVALMKVRDRLPVKEVIRLVDRKLAELSGAPFVEGLIASMDTPDRSLKEALVRLLGLIGDERAIGGLLEACCDDRLAGCAMQGLRGMGERAAQAIKGLYPGADNDRRCIITYICGELRFPGCESLLADAMREESPLLRRVSVIAAGNYGSSGLIGDIAHLLEDCDYEVREGAIEALSRLSGVDGEAVQRIAVALLADGDPEKRRNSARLFAAMGDGDRLSLLIKDEDATVRRNAVDALALLKKGSGGSHLLMALVDEDADVRAAVAEALGELGGEDVVAPLLLVLKDEDPAVRCAALKSLGKLRAAGARQAIVELLDMAADGLLTISALNTLAEIDGEGASEPLKKALANPDEEIVKAAMEILSRFGDAWLDEYRDLLLYHSHWDVRRNFIGVMVENRGAKAVPYLRSVLETESDDLVKEQILNILDRFK